MISYKITLTEEETENCYKRATAAVAYYADMFGERGSGTYNHNSIKSNVVGTLGENGCSKWL